MSLQDYQDGVDIFTKKVDEWEKAFQYAEQLETEIPTEPETTLAKQTINNIILSVRGDSRFQNPNAGRYVLSQKAQQRWAAKVEPQIQREIKIEIAAASEALRRKLQREIAEYNAAVQLLEEALKVREKIREELQGWTELIFAESGHVLPLLPDLNGHEDELNRQRLATRGTLLRRVIIDPRQLNQKGDTTLLYTTDFISGSLGDNGFVEFAPPGDLQKAVNFAKHGDPMDTKERDDAVIIAVDHRNVPHIGNQDKIKINSDALRNQPIRIFRAA